MTAWTESKRALADRNYGLAESAQMALDSATARHEYVSNAAAAGNDPAMCTFCLTLSASGLDKNTLDTNTLDRTRFVAEVAARKARNAWLVADSYYHAVQDATEHKWVLLTAEVNEAIANVG